MKTLTETIRALFPHIIDEVVICRDTAAAVLRMCESVDGLPLMFYVPKHYGAISSYYVKAIPVDDLDLTHTVLVEGIHVTDECRTILELIDSDAKDRVLFESLDDFFDHHQVSEIFPLAERYGITLATIQSLVPLAMQYFKERDDHYE